MVKAKIKITIKISDGPTIQVRTIFDYDSRTVKDLWDALYRTCSAWNTQMVINIER